MQTFILCRLMRDGCACYVCFASTQLLRQNATSHTSQREDKQFPETHESGNILMQQCVMHMINRKNA